MNFEDVRILFGEREAAIGEAMRAYWAGRIDGYCLRAGFSLNQLEYFARRLNFAVDWDSALNRPCSEHRWRHGPTLDIIPPIETRVCDRCLRVEQRTGAGFPEIPATDWILLREGAPA